MLLVIPKSCTDVLGDSHGACALRLMIVDTIEKQHGSPGNQNVGRNLRGHDGGFAVSCLKMSI